VYDLIVDVKKEEWEIQIWVVALDDGAVAVVVVVDDTPQVQYPMEEL